MQLTNAQKLTLKNWVIANNASRFDESSVALLNSAAAPEFRMYRDAVTWDEIMLNGMDWARVDNLSVGKARIWDWMFQNDLRACNPAKPNIRTGINAVWVGTAADLLVRDAVYAHCHRPATAFERLYATGDGTAPAAGGNGSGPGTPGTDANGAFIVGPVTLQMLIDSESAN